MDISRLPVTPFARPANTTSKANTGTASVEAVRPVDAPNRTQRSEQVFERVVQGELLQRERDPAHTQTTQEFINERRFEYAQDSEHHAAASHPLRSAIALYLDNTRPEAVADLTQGRSVNFFV